MAKASASVTGANNASDDDEDESDDDSEDGFISEEDDSEARARGSWRPPLERVLKKNQ